MILLWFFALSCDLRAAEPEAAPVPTSGETAIFRDPFQKPDFAKKMEVVDPLQRYSLDQFKLLGVMTGPDHLRAMVAAPDGKTYFIAEKAKIGDRKGVVIKITTKSIFVREYVLGVSGRDEPVVNQIKLPDQPTSTGTGG